MKLCGLVCTLLLLTAPSCSGQDPNDLFAIVQFEERQNNREHAIQLYEQIVRDYPQSDAAQRARQRLEELSGRK
jgi:TolA-binding protein